jgi:hypothetical protein
MFLQRVEFLCPYILLRVVSNLCWRSVAHKLKVQNIPRVDVCGLDKNLFGEMRDEGLCREERKFGCERDEGMFMQLDADKWG